jgi:diguanylate cyclase (GGDEF)-like protein
MSLHSSPAHTRPVLTRRGMSTFLVLLAAFIAMPWLVRPLEGLLPLVDVALVGNIAESAIGLCLGAMTFLMIRSQRLASAGFTAELERLTESDTLTGLGNTLALSRELERTLNRARRTAEPVTVLYFDIDALEDVNRRHGRATGDLTLRMMAAVLRSSVRYGIDTGYRLADDKFAIVLAASRDAAHVVRQRLEWNFQERTPRRSNLSVGVATWDGRKSSDGLVEEARRAMAAQRQTSMVAQMA